MTAPTDRDRATRDRLAEALHDARVQCGLTQQQVADRIGVSRAQVCHVETNRGMSVDTLSRYAAAVGLRLELTPEAPVSLTRFTADDITPYMRLLIQGVAGDDGAKLRDLTDDVLAAMESLATEGVMPPREPS